jgi:hypothetical protein
VIDLPYFIAMPLALSAAVFGIVATYRVDKENQRCESKTRTPQRCERSVVQSSERWTTAEPTPSTERSSRPW